MSGTLAVGGLTFAVRRSARRRTLGLTVDRGGELVVHAPAGSDDAELARWAHGKLGWVYQMLARKSALAAGSRVPEFVPGESFAYLGRRCRLAVVQEADVPLRLAGDRFILAAQQCASGADQFRRWFTAAGTAWVGEQLPRLVRRSGRAPARVEVRELGMRWGACSPEGAVSMDWRLFQLAPRLIEYVAMHELAHLHHLHHGPAFRAVLDRTLPDWADRRRELAASAREIFWCASGAAL